MAMKELPGFWDSLNQSAQNIAPLALKKWELDNAATRWEQEFGLAKAKHDQAMKLGAVETQLKDLALQDTIGLRDRLQKMVQPTEVSTPVPLGIGAGISDFPEGTELPVAKSMVTPKITAEGLSSALAQSPFHADKALAGMVSQENVAERLKSAMEVMQARNASTEQIADTKMKMAEIMAKMGFDGRVIAAIIAAGARNYATDNKPDNEPLVKVTIDGKEKWVRRSEADNMSTGKDSMSDKALAITAAKVMEIDNDSEQAKTLAKLYNSASKTDKLEYGGVYGMRKWRLVPKTPDGGGTATSGSAGGYTWTSKGLTPNK